MTSYLQKKFAFFRVDLSVQEDLASTNAPVRNAATHLMINCHKQLGPDLASMIHSKVKPALMTSLQEAFTKNPRTQVAPLPFPDTETSDKIGCITSWQLLTIHETAPVFTLLDKTCSPPS